MSIGVVLTDEKQLTSGGCAGEDEVYRWEVATGRRMRRSASPAEPVRSNASAVGAGPVKEEASAGSVARRGKRMGEKRES